MSDITQSPAFRAALSITKELGPFSNNPKIDEAYRTLRLMGVPANEAVTLINDEIERRKSPAPLPENNK
jgi:hypothetical protein